MASRIQPCTNFDEAQRLLDAKLLWLRYGTGWFNMNEQPYGEAEFVLSRAASKVVLGYYWTVDKFGYLTEDDSNEE